MPHLKCESLAEAVARLVEGAVGHSAPATALADEIMRREAEGSTAVGGGLVIPHARFAGVDKVRIAVATLSAPLDLAAADGQAVDVVILLVGPTGDPRLMLRVLARLARLVKQDGFLDGLRTAPDPAALRQAFARADQGET